jgi:hypothetical protein
LQRLQRFPLLGQLMRKLFDLLAQLMDQGPNRRLALFKGRMDVLIGRGSKVHRMEHNPNNPCCATISKPEQSPAMKQLVINLKRHFDAERKNHKAVSTRNPTLRTAQGLDIGEITVKSIMAAYRQHGPTMAAHAAKPRGKPEYRAAVPLQPVIREDVRRKP